MAAKARHVANSIRALSNTVRGAPVQLLRQAVQACMLTVLCYGAEAWWPGSSRTERGKEVSNQVTSRVNQLDLVLRDALRGVLPVYKTTPIPALHREIGIPPMKLVLEHRCVVFAIRIKRLDSWHPLADTAESHNPLASPPWARTAKKDDSQIGFQATCSKEQAAKDFKTWLQKRNPLDLVVFTDDSQLVHPQRAAGAGWAICWGRNYPVVETGNLPLPKAEVFDAEVTAALHRLRAATSSMQAKERFPHTTRGKVIVRWVPGHAGVAAVSPHDGPATLAYMRRQIEEQAMQAFKEYWAQNSPRRYIELEIPLQKASTEMKLPRFTLGKLYAACTGHGDFAEYHTHWQHEDAECHCRCGSHKSPEHFYYCLLARHTTVQRQRSTYSVCEMLATSKGVQGFHNWIKETAFYRDICPIRKLPTTANGLPLNIPF
ncbi:hypothetical protein VTO42DRAFT_4689 [Malbranchea cinnamomea]